jgi:hypothetical protein
MNSPRRGRFRKDSRQPIRSSPMMRFWSGPMPLTAWEPKSEGRVGLGGPSQSMRESLKRRDTSREKEAAQRSYVRSNCRYTEDVPTQQLTKQRLD